MSVFELLGHGFVQRLIIVAILMAVCGSLIGVPLVLRRYSFMGFGLSNVAFMGVSIAIVLNLANSLALVIPLTIAATVVLVGLGGKSKKVASDASLAMLTVGSLAVGHFAINTLSMRGNITADVSGTLFGGMNLLTLMPRDIWLCIGVTAAVILFYALFYKRIFAVTFDADFMQATGQRPIFYELMLSVITGVVISISMNLLGSLLTAAVIIFPALSAMRLFKTYKSVIMSSVIIAAVCSAVGIFVAIVVELPPTTTIILVNIALFIILSIAGGVRRLVA
jgi:zinc transport system permease protein